MIDVKSVIGIASVVISFCNLVYYLWQVYFGAVRPHVISWLIWAVVTGIAAAGQVMMGAGSGSWITIAIAVFSLVRLCAAYMHGDRNVRRSDWVCLAACLAAIVLWLLTKDPFLSVVVVTSVDVFGLYPTLRKSWHDPEQESLASFFLFGFVSLLGVLATENYNATTLFYPCVIILACWGFCIFLIWRRGKMLPSLP